jgi:hypothetical protein
MFPTLINTLLSEPMVADLLENMDEKRHMKILRLSYINSGLKMEKQWPI